MNNKNNVLYSLAILLVSVIYFPLQAQQTKGTHRANFSGEWRSQESISMGGNIVCTYNAGDRMLAKIMKVITQPDFLTIEASSSFADETPVFGREKLSFDGKAIEIDHGQGRGKKSTIKWSADGQTMTVNSTVRLVIGQKPETVYVTEVWKLSNDGQSIIVQTNAKATMFDEGRNWVTVFERVG